MAEKLSGSFGSAAKSGRVPTHPICSWWGLAYCKYDLGCGHSGFVGEDDSLPPNTEYENELEDAASAHQDDAPTSLSTSATQFFHEVGGALTSSEDKKRKNVAVTGAWDQSGSQSFED